MNQVLFCLFSIVALTGIYVFFSLASASISRGKLSRLLAIAERRKCCVSKAKQILESPDPFLISTQLARFISVLLTGFALLSLIDSSPVSQLALRVAEGDNAHLFIDAFGFLAICSVSFLVFFLLQITREIASSNPERVLCYLSPIVYFSYLCLSPLIFVVDRLAGGFLRKLGFQFNMRPELSISSQEINEFLELSTESGAIEEEEKEMIQSVFTFGDTVVREVMTPRQDIVSIEITANISRILKTVINSGVSRLVVIGTDLDDVRGVLHVKDLLPFIERGRELEIRRIIRPPLMVPNTLKIGDLMNQFREMGVHIAVVVDEHGGVDGIVTMEDLIEEIVGEVFDEYDIPDEERPVCKTKQGDFLVDGKMLIEDLNNQYSFNLPEGKYETIAGFVIDRLGHIPESGENFDFEGVLVKVEKVSHNKVDLLRLIVPRRVGQLKVIKGPSNPEFNDSSRITSIR